MNQSTVTDEIWSILRETQKNLKELSVSQKETDQQIKKFSEELSASQKETDQQIKKFSEEFQAGQKEFQAGQKEFQASQKELSASQKELSASQKETDQQIKKFSEELSASQKETDQQIKKFSEELSASQKETDQQIKKFSEEFQAGQKEFQAGQKELQDSQKETDKQLKKTDARFNSQWGKLVESLVEGKLVEILNEWGIEVRQTAQRVEVSYMEKNGKIQRKEFDILVVNGTEIVVVEVKTTLRPSDVSYFLEALKGFKKYCPQYKFHAVYGAVAYLRSDAKAASYSEGKGLFVIRATGDSASIVNEKGFKPRVFS